MKYNVLLIFIFVCVLFPCAVHAVEVAPRITDREIIEKLARLEAGQEALRAEMKSGIQSLRSEMKSGQESFRSEMKSDQEALRSEMKSNQEALRSEMKSSMQSLRTEMKSSMQSLRSEMRAGQEALNKRIDDINLRIDDLNNTMLTLFSAIVALIVGIFAYIAWDRRTMMRPMMERLDRLEQVVVRDLDMDHAEGSIVARHQEALREFAKHEPRLAEIMRSLSLL